LVDVAVVVVLLSVASPVPELVVVAGKSVVALVLLSPSLLQAAIPAQRAKAKKLINFVFMIKTFCSASRLQK
jgi:hypothetical protein